MAAGKPMIEFLYNGSEELRTPSKDAYPASTESAHPDVGDSVAALLVKKKEKKRRRR